MTEHNPTGDCVRCEPVVVDMETGTPKVIPALTELYRLQPLPVKQAWHRVTCDNSRAPWDLQAIEPFVKEMQRVVMEDDVS